MSALANMSKSPDAFRTISEVADWLGTPAHVLRFWESRFTQIKPVKRAGGRRYYRPSDMLLLGGIKKLLHEDGITIRGVQKILREQGIKHVASLSPSLDGGAAAGDLIEAETVRAEPAGGQEPAENSVLSFARPAEDTPEPAAETVEAVTAEPVQEVLDIAPPPSAAPAEATPETADDLMARLRELSANPDQLDAVGWARLAVLYGRLKALRDRVAAATNQ